MQISKKVLICLALAACLAVEAKPLNVKTSANNAVLVNAETGAILYAKDAEIPCFPASTTKVATAIYTLKKKGHCLDEILTASQDAVLTVPIRERRAVPIKHPPYRLEYGGTHMGLRAGEQMSLRMLMYGLMLSSGNDASNVIAEYVSGSVPHFMDELNAYLKSIGCQHTTFYTPHGMPYAEHKTTALDMARMTQEALKDPFFKEVVKSTQYLRPKTNLQEPITLAQSNRLLLKGPFYYPKAIGVKTGYTISAGTTLVAAAEENGRTLIAVLFGYTDGPLRFKDAIALFDAAFNEPLETRTLFTEKYDPFSLPIKGAKNTLTACLTTDLKLSYYPAEEPTFKAYLRWNVPRLPIQKGKPVGDVEIVNHQGKVLAKGALCAAEDVEMTFSARCWDRVDTVTSWLPRLLPKGAIYLLALVSFISLLFLLSALRRLPESQKVSQEGKKDG